MEQCLAKTALEEISIAEFYNLRVCLYFLAIREPRRAAPQEGSKELDQRRKLFFLLSMGLTHLMVPKF